MSTSNAEIEAFIAELKKDGRLNEEAAGQIRKKLTTPKREHDARVKVVRWVIFGFVFAFVPIACNAASLYLRGQELNLYDVIYHGELFLIVALINAAALGEALHPEKTGKHPSIELIFAGFCAALMLITGIIYGNIVGALDHGVQKAIESAAQTHAVTTPERPGPTQNVWLTIMLLSVTLLASSICVWLSEQEKEV